MSIHWPIIRTCALRPTRTLIVDERRSWRGIDLLVGAMHLAGEIERRSESPHVAVMLPASGAFPMAALAAWIAGRVVVPLNFLLSREELQYVIDDSGVDLVLTAQPMLEHLGFEPRARSLLRLEGVSFRGVPDLRWPATAEEDDLGVLLYTSGTSGKPKGVELTHGNISANIHQCWKWSGFSDRDVALGVLPQFHCFGLTVLTLLPLTVGAKVVYAPRFVPQKIVRLFKEHRPTVFVGIPSMFNALMSVKSAEAEDFSALRFAVSGGEPLPDAVASAFRERFGVTINEGYGLTETSPVTNWCMPDDYAPHTVGPPLPRVQERIVDPATGAPLGPNEEGEIRIKGPNVMRGYYRLPELTAEVFDHDGWFRTGDIGKLDEKGRLFITGRLKEMIIVGGENVFPREIEEVLNRHPSVEASGVIGVRDEVRGELPWAWVETKEGESFDEPALRTWCRERLAGYKVPREIRVVGALPRNPTGKIMRRALRDLIEQPAPSAG